MSIKSNVKILRLDDQGRGIGYINDKIVFIPNTLPTEEVIVKIVKDTSKYYVGKVIEYKKVSDKRIEVNCPYYDLCGGCNLLHMSYEDSIDYKLNKLKNLLFKFANLSCNIEVIENKYVFNYRNKIEFKIKNYEWGYYNSNTHNFVSVNECLLAKSSINKVIDNKDLFDIASGSIIIRSNYNDEILIDINSDDKVYVDVDKLKNQVKLIGIVINDKVYYGEKYFIEKFYNKLFKVNYNSFFQINNYITKKMIKIISDNSYGNTLLDLYCGVGFLGQCVSDKYKKIYGIEINKDSIIDAINNAKINNIKNAYYLCGDSAKCISKINDKIDTLLIDPPRTGLVKNMVQDVINVGAEKIIYVSCNPISLARDLNNLKELYDVEKTYLLDMFSNTYHFESIIILQKNNLLESVINYERIFRNIKI